MGKFLIAEFLRRFFRYGMVHYNDGLLFVWRNTGESLDTEPNGVCWYNKLLCFYFRDSLTIDV
jgi:hypothetical protein